MKFKEFLLEEDGSGVVEVILITVVIIALVLLFKGRITALVNTILKKIEAEAKKV